MPPRIMYEVTTATDTFRRFVPAAPRFRPGQKVKLPAELGGKVAGIVDGYGPGLWQVRVDDVDFVVSDHVLKKAAPEWRPGDVVVVRYADAPRATPYTYVRGRRIWPGETNHKTDEQIDALYLLGKATPVLQAGGEPFATERL